MRPLPIALLVALVLLAPSFGSAQSLQPFQDLALRINLDDRLQIEDLSGATTSGRLMRLTRDEITIKTDTGEKRLAAATVRGIEVRRRPIRKAVMIGAGVGAVLGALAGCAGSEREECADAPIILGALGAGIGLAAGALDPRSTAVYRSPTDTAPSRSSTGTAGPLDDLALRVNLGDRLRVEGPSGTRTTGRLTRLTGDEMTIETDAGEKQFTSALVREVAVRRYSLRRGALIGAVVFPVVLAAAPACRSNENCTPIAGAPIGAGVGLAVGTFIPRMTTVFRAQKQQASFWPAFSRGAIGIRASLSW